MLHPSVLNVLNMFVGIINYVHGNSIIDVDLAKYSSVLYESIITAWSKKENKLAEKNLKEKVNEKYLSYMRTMVLN